MKLRFMVIATIMAVASTLAIAADTPKTTTQASAAFDRLKSLSGEWESKNGEGEKSHTRYE